MQTRKLQVTDFTNKIAKEIGEHNDGPGVEVHGTGGPGVEVQGRIQLTDGFKG